MVRFSRACQGCALGECCLCHGEGIIDVFPLTGGDVTDLMQVIYLRVSVFR